MIESRPSSSAAGAALRKLVPSPALCGFLLLLALMFAVSYAVGAVAGPVAPGMHGTGTAPGDGGGGGGGGGMNDMQDMGAGHGGGNR